MFWTKDNLGFWWSTMVFRFLMMIKQFFFENFRIMEIPTVFIISIHTPIGRHLIWKMEFLNHSSIKYFCLWVSSTFEPIGWRLNILSNNESNRIKSGFGSGFWFPRSYLSEKIPSFYKILWVPYLEYPRIRHHPAIRIELGSGSNLELLIQKSDTFNVDWSSRRRGQTKIDSAIKFFAHISKFNLKVSIFSTACHSSKIWKITSETVIRSQQVQFPANFHWLPVYMFVV